MWSDELRSRWPLSPCEPCAWILLWSSVLFIFDQIILEHFPDVVFFYEIRCSMEMQYLIRHRFETPSTWIGTSVNLICTDSFPNSGLHHFKWRCDHTLSGRRTEAWLCCFSCIQHSVQWINSHIMIPLYFSYDLSKMSI